MIKQLNIRGIPAESSISYLLVLMRRNLFVSTSIIQRLDSQTKIPGIHAQSLNFFQLKTFHITFLGDFLVSLDDSNSSPSKKGYSMHRQGDVQLIKIGFPYNNLIIREEVYNQIPSLDLFALLSHSKDGPRRYIVIHLYLLPEKSNY